MFKQAVFAFLIFLLAGCSRSATLQNGSVSADEERACDVASAAKGDDQGDYLFDLRYPPKIARGTPYVPPSEEQKMWALATCALLTEVNQGRHDLLGGRKKSPEGIAAERRSLAEWWGVTSRDDLLEVLRWLEEGGHRKEFDKLAKFVASLSPKELADVQEQVGMDNQKACELDAVVNNYKDLGAKSIAGWDYSRYVAVYGWGAYAGYISEEEAWARIMPAARLLQQTFDSWEDLGRNYLIGRQFWSYEETKRGVVGFMIADMKLLTNPSSPWVRIPWDLDLAPQGRDARSK